MQRPIHCVAVAERWGDAPETMKPLPARAQVPSVGFGPKPAERTMVL